ncbi:MAG: MBL fold metallo-hydrolase [Alphaproteobacteria bacterium]|nr:MBL fold metallo-hydrolase [Alphaproteobacteria bacterium]
MVTPAIAGFHDGPTGTISYVVADPRTRIAAVVDPVLDYDARSARTGTRALEPVLRHLERERLAVAWILETHLHADHLSGAQALKARVGGKVAIGAGVTTVQARFAPLFGAEPGFATDGRQFDHLFVDDETFAVGDLAFRVLPTPGHTPACVAYHVADAVFAGDTIFMPDAGTARCDFPDGDAATLYRSIARVLALPPATRLFVCHDYGLDGKRAVQWETTVAAERAGNIHVKDGTSEVAFVALRRARDATLALPTLILPSVQVNMRAGHLPPAAADGRVYLQIPLDTF